MSRLTRPRSLALAALVTVALTACSDNEIQAPTPPADEGSLTVDASQGWAFASLADEATVPVADPRSSSAWDIAFNATAVMLNGGVAGPGGVSGYCICQNASATDEQILAMTPESELADFEAVDAGDIPDDASFQTETLVPAFSGWFTGSGAAAVAAPGTVKLLRLANGTSFAKVHVVGIAGASESNAGTVTIEYAVQPSASDPFGPTQTADLDAAAGTAIDLATGTTGDGSGTWDLKVQGFDILLNGGVSGSGQAAAAPTDEAFEQITTASTEPRAYQTDRFAGVFAEHPWYRYNLLGNNRIHPTFDVYLLKRGDVVYKVQLIDYYGPAGELRQISFRYARLTD